MESLEEKCEQSFVRKSYNTISKYTNLKWNLVGGFFGGLSAYYFNSEHGLFSSLSAGAKQIGYNLVMAGINIRMCERLATEINNKKIALTAAAVVPSIVAVGTNYLLHELTGTPDAFEATYLPLITAPPFFGVMGFIYRRNSEKDNQNP